jgi:hypothetical protein
MQWKLPLDNTMIIKCINLYRFRWGNGWIWVQMLGNQSNSISNPFINLESIFDRNLKIQQNIRYNTIKI